MSIGLTVKCKLCLSEIKTLTFSSIIQKNVSLYCNFCNYYSLIFDKTSNSIIVETICVNNYYLIFLPQYLEASIVEKNSVSKK